MAKSIFSPGPSLEVVGYFANKGLKPSFSWLDVWGEEHASSFTVAKAMQLDILTDIRSAIQKAIDEGQTFQQFKKDLTPHLQSKGWWGKEIVTDPLIGAPVKAQLGSPRRLKVIYEANIRSARAAGAWERAQRTKVALPYLMYMLGPSLRHRPHHASKAGLIFPIDHEFWDKWYPMNGWGCKCWTRQITRSEADRRGGVSDMPNIPTRPFTNKRTGETLQVPVGIDPGWHTNPGKLRQRNLNGFLAERLEAAPKTLRDVAVKDMVGSWVFRRIQSGEMGNLKVFVPVGVVSESIKVKLNAKSGVIFFSPEDARKQLLKRPKIRFEDYVLVQSLLDEGEIIRESDLDFAAQAFVAGSWWRAAFHMTGKRDEIFMKSLRRSHDDQIERYRKRGKKMK